MSTKLVSVRLIVAFACCGPLVSCDNAEVGPKEQAAAAMPAAEVIQPPAVATPEGPKKNPLRDAYFGEIHFHTQYSSDAYAFGTFVDPDQAYRFGKGEAIKLAGGATVKISTPLDFMAVTDHSEWFGEMQMVLDPTHPKYSDAWAKTMREAWKTAETSDAMFGQIFTAEKAGKRLEIAGPNGADAQKASETLWGKIVETANKHYEPGRFTTFSAFEWTSTPGGVNLHRNLIFRGTKVPARAISFFETSDPKDLWDWMEESAGGFDNVLAIPHNSNLSNGLMFRPALMSGEPYTAEIAAQRKAAEPLLEIAQMKGTSETNPEFAPNDEFANFELAPAVTWAVDKDAPKGESRFNWAREGLKAGLLEIERLGVNSLEYGFAGGTDAHDGLGGNTTEPNFAFVNPVSYVDWVGANLPIWQSTGSLTGVWAEANDRDDIWLALKRRETFATSGTRIRVRLFGGWSYPANALDDTEWVAKAYAGGVPMGSVMPGSPGAGVPKFIVWAVRAADGAPLDRVQMVKGSADGGKAFEEIYDLACSDGRAPDAATHRCAASKASVDLKDCSYSQDAGAATLGLVWTDPSFKASQPAFYYLRVIENPTCRWSTFSALRTGRPLSGKVPATLQERAWSSPIWYVPPRPQ